MQGGGSVLDEYWHVPNFCLESQPEISETSPHYSCVRVQEKGKD